MNSAITSQPVSREISIADANPDNEASPHHKKHRPHRRKIGPYVINLACGGLASVACGTLSTAAGLYATYFIAGALVGTCATGTTKLMTREVYEKGIPRAYEAQTAPVNTAATAKAREEPADPVVPGDAEEKLVEHF